MTAFNGVPSGLPAIHVDVVECGKKARRGRVQCEIGENLRFDLSGMESYLFARQEPVLHDALVVAAAVEFCDRIKRRPAHAWGRSISLHVPVHVPDHWSQASVADNLRGVLEFLTGDQWDLSFYQRERPVASPSQDQLNFRCDISAVMPCSDGLDSSNAAGLAVLESGERILRIQLGKKKTLPNCIAPCMEYFAAVPFSVRKGRNRFSESSVRSRGFKFSLASGIAAYLSNTQKIIVSESGQGTLGPCLVPVGQAYPDYRSHPRFNRLMEKFLKSLIGFDGRFEYPHIWNTKGETLAQFIDKTGGSTDWMNTRSCWQQNRQTGVAGKARQCGICAACLLRRLSIHAAGQSEPPGAYVWECLGARSFDAGVSPAFNKAKITGAMEQYAIAGTLHMDHLAALPDSRADEPSLDRESYWLGSVLGIPSDIVKKKLRRLLAQHKTERENFTAMLGAQSFLVSWISEAQR